MTVEIGTVAPRAPSGLLHRRERSSRHVNPAPVTAARHTLKLDRDDTG